MELRLCTQGRSESLSWARAVAGCDVDGNGDRSDVIIAMASQATRRSSTRMGGDTARTNMFVLYQCDAAARVVKGSPRVSTPTTAPMVRRTASVSTCTPSGSPSGVMAAGIQERGGAGRLSDSTTIALPLPLTRGDLGVVCKMACLLGTGSYSHARLHAFTPWLHAPTCIGDE